MSSRLHRLRRHPEGRPSPDLRGFLRPRSHDSKLVESAINGMLAGLDPHSSYMDLG
jgi:C-terminal processing protease CtpA/Prc